MVKHFPVVVREVKDLSPDHPYGVIFEENAPRYFIKASSDGADVEKRASVHFTLHQEDGAPRVGSILTVSVESDMEIGED